jgi:hypothetical protein
MNGHEFFQKIAVRPPFTKMHPAVGAFFKEYLSREKAIAFRGGLVVNTHFPPYPSPAFDNFAGHFVQFGKNAAKRLYSVTFAVTNRCGTAASNTAPLPKNVTFAVTNRCGTAEQVMEHLLKSGAGTVPIARGEKRRRGCLYLYRFLTDSCRKSTERFRIDR